MDAYSVCQLYTLLRHLLSFEKSPWEKLLLAAQFLDKLEEDFKEVYPYADSPMPNGYEAMLRDLFDNKFKGK